MGTEQGVLMYKRPAVAMTARAFFKAAFIRSLNKVISVDAIGRKTYNRDFNGGCFIGAAMPVGVSRNIRNMSSLLLSFEGILEVTDMTNGGGAFLWGLQEIHDLIPPKYWDENLRSFAVKYHLEDFHASLVKRYVK